jgi:hypothetical protein
VDEIRETFPPSPETVRLRNLVDDGRCLAGVVRNGHMRGQSQAYKRQWLQRVVATLDALAAEMEKRLPKENSYSMHNRIVARNLRSRELATERGEPEEEWIGRPVSPSKL